EAAHTGGSVDGAEEVLPKAHVDQIEVVQQEEDEQREVECDGRGEEEPEVGTETVDAPPPPCTAGQGGSQRKGVVPYARAEITHIVEVEAHAPSESEGAFGKMSGCGRRRQVQGE